MLNLFSLKEKKVEEAREGGSKKRTSAAQLRITKVTNDQVLKVDRLVYSSLHQDGCRPWTFYYNLTFDYYLRLSSQDINEMELPKTCKTEFPDPDDLLVFKLIIYPDEVRATASWVSANWPLFSGSVQRRRVHIQLQDWSRLSSWTSEGNTFISLFQSLYLASCLIPSQRMRQFHNFFHLWNQE